MQQITGPRQSAATCQNTTVNAGAVILTLISDNHASKLAVKMAKALLRPRDELQLVTVVTNEDSISYGNNLLAPYLQEKCNNNVTPVVSSCMQFACT